METFARLDDNVNDDYKDKDYDVDKAMQEVKSLEPRLFFLVITLLLGLKVLRLS